MEFLYNENTVKESANVTDRWVLSCMQSLVGFFETEMAGMTLGLDIRALFFLIALLMLNCVSL